MRVIRHNRLENPLAYNTIPVSSKVSQRWQSRILIIKSRRKHISAIGS